MAAPLKSRTFGGTEGSKASGPIQGPEPLKNDEDNLFAALNPNANFITGEPGGLQENNLHSSLLSLIKSIYTINNIAGDGNGNLTLEAGTGIQISAVGNTIQITAVGGQVAPGNHAVTHQSGGTDALSGTLGVNITGSSGSCTGNAASATTAVNGCPVGSVIAYATNVPPIGWLICNGAVISRTTYANLFAVIGTTFGSGDGSNTFNLPDLRGEFIRGWDNGRGIDSARTFASSQNDSLKSHNHTYYIPTDTGSLPNSNYFDIFLGSPTGGNYSNTTQNTGGTETRPRNIALLYCIKY